MRGDLIRLTDRGLFCEAGGFHIDPWKPVDVAVVTHAHADHVTSGCGRYIASANTIALMRSRMSGIGGSQTPAFGEAVRLGSTTVSLHPAGHVLGSSQVRVEPDGGGDIWCVTGDYKIEADPTCEAFELVPCDVLLTESTFGLPIYRWDPSEAVFDRINAWWRANAAAERTSVLLAYSLGKAQRVLGGLDASIGPIGVHGALLGPTAAYLEAGIQLPSIVHAKKENAGGLKGGGMIVCPPSASGSGWLRAFRGSGGVRIGMVSGWMRVRGRRRWQSVDTGFVLSDHADWDGLLATIRASGARRVGVTHGSSEALARFVRDVMGLDSFVVPTRFKGEGDGPATGSSAEGES
ncbi:MAG: ligase-associated DNA damage response exonuclease [Planctomycetota bacterium]